MLFKINFTDFDLASDDDKVRIYKDSLYKKNLLYTFTSENIPTEPIIILSSRAVVLFTTDKDDNVGRGWSLNYRGLENSIEENSIINSISVFPNPTKGDINISFNLLKQTNLNLRIYDMVGKIVYSSNYNASIGKQEFFIDKVFNESENGLYFIDIESKEFNITKKISVIR